MELIETLLLTGQHNHDWKRSAPFCRDLLEDSGRFSVTVAEDASAALENAQALRGVQLRGCRGQKGCRDDRSIRNAPALEDFLQS